MLHSSFTDRIDKCWGAEDWLSQLEQTQRNILAFEYKDFWTPLIKNKTTRAPDTAHVNIKEVGRRLIRSVDGVKTLLPPGFGKLMPKIATDQSLAGLANLMSAQGKHASREDAEELERDIIHILRLMGLMIAEYLESNLKNHRLSQFSLLEAAETAYRE